MTWKLSNTPDPYYGAVSLLLHGDGTKIIDSSPRPKTVTAVGDAQISTEQSKFGGSSLKFDGNGDKVSSSASSEWVFGIQDFTIEAWMYLQDSGSNKYPRLMNFGPYWQSNDAWGICAYDFDYPGKVTLVSYKLGASRLCVSTTTISADTWYHVAVTRSSGVFRLFINGVLESTNSSYTTTTIESSATNTFCAGSSTTTSGDEDMRGYIDDLRITKGVARYTSNFTPPKQPFRSLMCYNI